MILIRKLSSACRCSRVKRHDQCVALGLAIVTFLVSWRIGQSYGWHAHNGRVVDDLATILAWVGFAISAFCVVSVPLARVDGARLAVGSLFVSYTYLGAAIVPGISWADRFSRIALYLTVAIAAAARLVEQDVREIKRELEKDWER